MRFPDLRRGPQAEAFRAYLRETDPQIPDGCESLRACADRARAFLAEVAGLQGRSLVASHSLFIRVLACEVLDVVPATYRHFKLSNAHAVPRSSTRRRRISLPGLTFRPPEPGGARSFGLWIGHAFDRSRLTGCTPKPGTPRSTRLRRAAA